MRLFCGKNLTIGVSVVAACWAVAAAAHTTTTIVTITSEGFVPREVTVDDQTIVNFVNTDTTAHWPASDPHPLHDRYPEFDPAHPIESGNWWIFRPTKVGTWTYHDHLSPHRRGTLRVVPEAAGERASPQHAPTASRGWTERLSDAFTRFAQRVARVFQRKPALRALEPADFRALPEKEQYAHVAELARARGLFTAWQYVKRTYTNDAGASLGGRGHDLAHFLGGLMWKERGIGGLSLCDVTFAFGCYHGFTEAAFTESLDRLPDVARACETIGPQNSGPWASCIHGIGHGVASYYASSDLPAALRACDRLFNGAAYCHDGVFMEFSFSAAPSFYRKDDPLYPCTAVAPRYQQACARNQPQIMQRLFGLDRRGVAAACTAHAPTIADPCIDALGFAVANESQGSAERIVAACRELPTPLLQATCTSAAAGELVFQNFPNWQVATRAACDALPPAFQPACQQRVRETSANYRRQN